MTVRSGIGFDAHRFAEGRTLVLGGVAIPEAEGLAGHSDADVLTHAVIDALLGAAGLGDIGAVFPSDDPRWKDANSIDLLGLVRGMLAGEYLSIGNVDAVVIAERPRLSGHRDAMRRALAEALDVDDLLVGVKFTTTDGMGFTGRGDGIAAFATAVTVTE